MGKEIITFGNIKFHLHKSLISIYNINVDRVVVSSRVLFCEKGFYWIRRC